VAVVHWNEWVSSSGRRMRDTGVVPDRGISFSKVIADAVKKTHNPRALAAVVRRESKGKTRDEAREILITETRRAGGEPLGQPFLDRQLDMIPHVR
jgi:hypothetical protein